MRVTALALLLLAAAPVQAEPVEVEVGGVDVDNAYAWNLMILGGTPPECPFFVVGVNPDHVPPKVAAGPDWMCIEDTIEQLLGEPVVRMLPFPT